MQVEFDDILSRVQAHAEADPQRLCTTLVSRRVAERSLSFGELTASAERAAGWFHAHGLRRGEIVVFLGTHHIDLYAAWLGVLWCGGIPTILADPSARIDREIYWTRTLALLDRCQAWGIALDPRIQRKHPALEGRRIAEFPEIVAHSSGAPQRFRPAPDDLMLLQHSSGTTGLQKGVMLSYGAIWRHACAYRQLTNTTGDDSIATWLPLYHDMGFIACFVDAMLVGAATAWLSPFEWVASPGLLLEAVTRHCSTLVYLPNFAFAFIAGRVKQEPGRYDLSSLRAVVNCSEPVSADAMQAFADRFSADGLDPGALQTCYAMAENVFGVTSTNANHPPRTLRVERAIWNQEHRAQATDGDGVTCVSSGVRLPDCDIRVIDNEGRELPALQAGKIWVRSPYLFDGYFRRDDLNEGLYDRDGFFDTGDTGFCDESGHYYITGRTKDIVIVGGKNIYPQDVEQAVGRLAGVKDGRVVAFGVAKNEIGTQGLVVLFESELPTDEWPKLAQQVRAAVPAQLDVDLADARVAPIGTLRKSTSGKLARDGNREWYLEGRFDAPSAATSPT